MAVRADLLWLMLVAAFNGVAAEQGYVDPGKCQPCHQRIFDLYRKTGMGRSFAGADRVPALTELSHEASGRLYSVVERAGAFYVRRALSNGASIT
jgi:hypothetical protein